MSDAAVPPSGRMLPAIISRLGRYAPRSGWLELEGFAAALLFVACFLGPLSRSPLILGDLNASLVPGLEMAAGRSLGELSRGALSDDLAAGRFAPLAAVLDPWIARYWGGAAQQKWTMLGLVLANAAMFYALLRRWQASASLAAIGTASLALLITLRVADDPVLAGHGWMQAAMGLVLAALGAFDRHRSSQCDRTWQCDGISRCDGTQKGDQAPRTWLVASAALFAFAMLIDPASHALWLVFPAAAIGRGATWRAALHAVRYHLLAAAILFAVATALRLGYALTDGPGYQMHWSLPKMARTVSLEAIAALPLSYPLLCESQRHVLTKSLGELASWRSGVVLLFAFGLALTLLRRVAEAMAAKTSPGVDPSLARSLVATTSDGAAGNFRRMALLVGLALWLGPALSLAAWPYYQDRAEPGLAARSVYCEEFGVALVGLAALDAGFALVGARWRIVSLGLAASGGIVAAVAFASNESSICQWRQVVDYNTRSTLEAAFAAGLGEQVPSGSTVLMTTWRSFLDLRRPEVANAFFSQCLGRPVDVLNATPGTLAADFASELARRPGPIFAVCEQCPGEDSGWVILSQVEDCGESFGAGGPLDHTPIRMRRFRVFVREGTLSPVFYVLPNLVFGHVPSHALGQCDRRRETIDTSSLGVVRRGWGWALYEGEFPEPADAGALGMAGHPVLTAIHAAPERSRR